MDGDKQARVSSASAASSFGEKDAGKKPQLSKVFSLRQARDTGSSVVVVRYLFKRMYDICFAPAKPKDERFTGL